MAVIVTPGTATPSQQPMAAAPGPRLTAHRGRAGFIIPVLSIVAACTGAGSSPIPAAVSTAPSFASAPPAWTASPQPVPSALPVMPAPFVFGPALVPFGDPIVVDPEVTSATTTAHGIRVSIRADASRFSSADGLWVTTSLENVGSGALRWITDGCTIHVGVSAETALDWSYGAEQPGAFGTFKDWALGRTPNWEPYPIYLRTVPAWAIDEGEFGCADLGVGHQLKAGDRLEARLFVRATTGRDGDYGLPPAAPVMLTATFGSWYRGKEDPEAPFRGEPVVARFGVELADGRDPALLSPGQAIDVALQSEALQAMLRAHPRIPDFAPTMLVLDPEAEQWRVGLTLGGRADEAHLITVVVDARNATVLGVGEER